MISLEVRLKKDWHKFNDACLKRFKSNKKKGWFEWDNPVYKEGLLKETLFECKNYQIRQKDLVDIANYCNFLWNMIEREGGEIIE